MVVVKAKPGEPAERLIARFRKRVIQSKIIDEVRDRSRHKAKAERRKEQKYRIKHLREIAKKRESFE